MMTVSLIQFLPDWAPNLHPLVVHFPIAILIFAALMDLISFVLPERWWGERKTAITYLVGGICTVLVLFSGEAAAHSLDVPKIAYDTLGHHAGWATWTAWFFGVYGVIRFITAFFTSARRPLMHVVFFLISLVGLSFLYETAEHGGELVYKYGLGTGNMAMHSTVTNDMNTPGFHRGPNGDISWMASKNSARSLGSNIRFLQGDSASLNTQLVSPPDSTKLNVQNPDFFMVTDSNSYTNVEVEVKMDPATYQGNITLAHHVHDSSNYGYMTLQPNGIAQLGRYKNGQRSIIKKGSFQGDTVRSVKLDVSGEHIHGAVNGHEILHGHSKPTGRGAAGLKLSGNGMVSLKQFSVKRISTDADHDGD